MLELTRSTPSAALAPSTLLQPKHECFLPGNSVRTSSTFVSLTQAKVSLELTSRGGFKPSWTPLQEDKPHHDPSAGRLLVKGMRCEKPNQSTALRCAEHQRKHNCVLDVLTLVAYGGC